MPTSDAARPPLDREALRGLLTGPGRPWRAVEVVDALPSTNVALAERARAGEPPGLVLVAEHQTTGRGRLDRVWETPDRAALTFSVLADPAMVPAARWSWLPMLVGTAVAEAVRRLTGLDCALKWPNDVLVGERKLAGILVERVERRSHTPEAVAVAGVGLNVSTTAAELPVPTATSLFVEGADPADRTALLVELLTGLGRALETWIGSQGDPGTVRSAYLRLCATVGRTVRVELPGDEAVTGTARGVDDAGRLLVGTDTGERAFAAGDVVHLRVP